MTGFKDNMEEAGSQAVEALKALVGDGVSRSVFSDPVAMGDDLVITAAAWERGGGFGFGGGGEDGEGSGFGSGGGAGAQGRPVAVIRVGPEGIEVRPIIDLTKVGITVLLAAVGVWKAIRR